MEIDDLGKGMPPNTLSVFDRISNSNFINQYTLIGGTALSIQIHHRLSEDLDFILDSPTLNNSLIKREMIKVFPDYRIIRDDKDYQLDFVINDCKVTFISTGTIALPFKVRPLSFLFRNTRIANIDTIAVLKLSAIAQRNTLRDYYDLFYISKYFIPLKTIFDLTRKLNPNLSPITYLETITYTKDISEDNMEAYLDPKEIISKSELEEYFVKELKKIHK